VRSTLHDTGASYTAIGLARESADAARRNFELVQDSYGRGVVSIIDLLDAQNAALEAELAAADALYQFFDDLLTHQRSVNRFDFFATPQENEAWLERLDAYFQKSGVEPLPPNLWWIEAPEDSRESPP
jgi:translation elongation factor EF-4